jgi:dipeptidyl-peptidase-3
MRGYYEAWVAIVDKEQSKKFNNLVQISESLIPKLPWPKEQEKDTFLAPDFTTLEIISFATNSCPLGINIPNYDDIRETEGFKNVYLANSAASYSGNKVSFTTSEQSEILTRLVPRTYEVHVACHELLGHGVGKLLYRNADGSVTPVVDPISEKELGTCYEEGETWNSKFGKISASYEECRADTCGFYLCTFPEVYTIFGFEEKEEDTKDLLWTNVMQQFRKGILGTKLFNTD